VLSLPIQRTSACLGYDRLMKPTESPDDDPSAQMTLAAEPPVHSAEPAEEAEGPEILEYDVWKWHTQGRFPADQPAEQGYVHMGIFIAWLVFHDMLDAEWVAGAGVKDAVTAIHDRRGTVAALRDVTDGRLASDMLTEEGAGFTGAYYAPEYGYASDWRRVFGRGADRYQVPGDWDTYDRIEPLVELRYQQGIEAGRPELMPLTGPLSVLLRFFRPRIRSR
jgi:hypothetical protein